MPRSETGTTSSDSSDSSSFDDDSDWNDSLDSDAIQADMAASDDEAEFGPDEPPGAHLPSAPPAAESVQREMEFELKRQSFVEELAKQLCRIYSGARTTFQLSGPTSSSSTPRALASTPNSRLAQPPMHGRRLFVGSTWNGLGAHGGSSPLHA